jgi:uncharacterized membrane protein YdfJ with MMPL/SSD domain
VEPIMVALLFGVVTDYGRFYMSRFRRRLREGVEPQRAVFETARELTPADPGVRDRRRRRARCR